MYLRLASRTSTHQCPSNDISRPPPCSLSFCHFASFSFKTFAVGFCHRFSFLEATAMLSNAVRLLRPVSACAWRAIPAAQRGQMLCLSRRGFAEILPEDDQEKEGIQGLAPGGMEPDLLALQMAEAC
eukprot:s592_g10.t1